MTALDMCMCLYLFIYRELLTGRPGHITAGKQVHMDMEDRLPCFLITVNNRAITIIIDTTLFSDSFSRSEQFTQHLCILLCLNPYGRHTTGTWSDRQRHDFSLVTA